MRFMGLRRARCGGLEDRALADAAVADVQWNAQALLHLREQHDAGREDVCARTVDAEPPRDRPRGLALDEAQRFRELDRTEVGTDEPARGARAAAHGERGGDPL